MFQACLNGFIIIFFITDFVNKMLFICSVFLIKHFIIQLTFIVHEPAILLRRKHSAVNT